MNSNSDPISIPNTQEKHRAASVIRKFILFHFLVGLIGWYSIFQFFESPQPPSCCPLPVSCLRSPKGLYTRDFSFDFHAFLSENETKFNQESQLIGRELDIAYGDNRSVLHISRNVSISEVGGLGEHSESIQSIENKFQIYLVFSF